MDPLQRSARNQVPPLTGHDVVATDRALGDAMATVAGDESSQITAPLEGLGRVAGSEEALLAGMGMTEKQGGADVRANLTEATPTGVDGEYVLRGHKWFCSAPMNDVFLMLAQAPDGLSCFVVPRVLPDGTRNPFAIVRLKDKLGNRSNASAQIELDGTLAR